MQLVVQPTQPPAQVLAHLGIESAEGLVEQKDLRLDGECASERNALALTAGELGGKAILQPGELDEFEQLVQHAARISDSLGRLLRGLTRKPKATFSNTVMCRNSA